MTTDSSSRDTDPSPIDDPRVRAHALVYLFGAGSGLGLLSLLLPHSGDTRALATIGLIGLVTSACLLMVARPALVHAVSVLKTSLISALVFFAGASGTYAAFYVWVSLYSFYFFTRAQAGLYVLLVAVQYGAVLLVGPPSRDAFARWLITVGTMSWPACW